jgi:hypothetical protein
VAFAQNRQSRNLILSALDSLRTALPSGRAPERRDIDGVGCPVRTVGLTAGVTAAGAQ